MPALSTHRRKTAEAVCFNRSVLSELRFSIRRAVIAVWPLFPDAQKPAGRGKTDARFPGERRGGRRGDRPELPVKT